MMTLAEYLKSSRTKQEDFAATIGVTQATVSRLVRGVALPNIPMAAAIKAATDGKVDFEAWVTSATKPTSTHNQEPSHDTSPANTAPDAA
ncbi:helix-turn-helix transcriptional regulator [Paracoccus sp. SM22M-07]|uniref:helix-turn-helix transcriptional regulator n=1 Tax=Paracoccus sp. SM22M-07 TaxID=1520813 RepID=UPI000930D04F|nr:helix-turn-helix transcriptional regulator [Paracoccus sp. SM22M-07]